MLKDGVVAVGVRVRGVDNRVAKLHGPALRLEVGAAQRCDRLVDRAEVAELLLVERKNSVIAQYCEMMGGLRR